MPRGDESRALGAPAFVALPALVARPRRTALTPAAGRRGGARPSVCAVVRRTPPRTARGAAGDGAATGGKAEPPKEGEEAAGSGAVEVPNALPADVLRALSGKGEDGCVQCDGVGTIACPVCSGTGFLSLTMMDTVSASQCRLCKGRGVIPCPSCRQFVYKSVMWWDEIPSDEEDPNGNWRTGPDGTPRIPWSPPPG